LWIGRENIEALDGYMSDGGIFVFEDGVISSYPNSPTDDERESFEIMILMFSQPIL
jgi:hypothetical protein